MNTPGSSISGYVLLLTIQFAFLVIFGIYTDYDDGLRPKNGTQADEGFIIPKYARKSDWFYAPRDAVPQNELLPFLPLQRQRFSRYSRNDFHRFRLFDDIPEAIRLQRNGIKFIRCRSLHPMGDSNARIFRYGKWNNQVSISLVLPLYQLYFFYFLRRNQVIVEQFNWR